MKLSNLALILSTSCFLLSSCGPEVKTVPLNLKAEKPEWFVCEKIDPETNRPSLPAGYQIDWSTIQTVEQAKSEHDAYVASIVERNGIVAGYIVILEGVNFTCWNSMQTQRDYYDALPPPPNH